MDLSWLASVNGGMPPGIGIAVNGHLEITGSDPLLNDLFELDAGVAWRCSLRTNDEGWARRGKAIHQRPHDQGAHG